MTHDSDSDSETLTMARTMTMTMIMITVILLILHDCLSQLCVLVEGSRVGLPLRLLFKSEDKVRCSVISDHISYNMSHVSF